MGLAKEIDLSRLITQMVLDPSDDQALALFMEQTERRLFRDMASRFSSFDPQKIDFICNQAFYRVWKYARTYRGKNNKSAYGFVSTIAKNIGLNLVKKENREHTFEKDIEGMLEKDNSFEGSRTSYIPDDSLIGTENKILHDQGIEEFIKVLSLREEEVFKDLFDGLKVTEIAEKDNVSKSSVSHIRKAIQEKYEKFYE